MLRNVLQVSEKLWSEKQRWLLPKPYFKSILTFLNVGSIIYKIGTIQMIDKYLMSWRILFAQSLISPVKEKTTI